MMPAACRLAALCIVAAASVASAQVETAPPVRQSAPLVFANRTIIVLRGPIAGYSARERVVASGRRIEDALEANADRGGLRGSTPRRRRDSSP